MERGAGIEPATLAWKARVIPFYEPRETLERLERIELSSQPWQGRVLPLNYSRNHCQASTGSHIVLSPACPGLIINGD